MEILTLISNVYKKPTDTKTIHNFHAACSWSSKSGLIKYFLNKALILCNKWFTFHEEISKLKDIFHTNGHHKEIFDKHVKKFLTEKLTTSNSCQNMDNEKKYTVIILNKW